MQFRTRYGAAAQRILMRFGATDSAVIAIETLVLTAERNVKQKNGAEMAKATCRGLHMDHPGAGVVCAKCFDAAMGGARDRAISGDQLATLRPRLAEETAAPGGGSAGGEGLNAAGITAPELPEAPAIDYDAVAAQAAEIIGVEPAAEGQAVAQPAATSGRRFIRQGK